MNETDKQIDVGQDWGVDWWALGTWFRLALVTGHLLLIFSAALTFSALVVERVLPYEGKTQAMMGVVIAILLMNLGVFSNLMMVERTQPNGCNPFSILPEGTLWQLFFFLFWVFSFSLLNVFLVLEIWTLLSFESSVFYGTALITMSAILSFPYVVAMLRGGRANGQ